MPIGCVNHVPEHPSTISPVHTRGRQGGMAEIMNNPLYCGDNLDVLSPRLSSGQQRRPSSGNRRQVPACGIVENALVEGHQCGIRHPRRGDDQPVSRVAMKYVR
jgi:hypothetical protein